MAGREVTATARRLRCARLSNRSRWHDESEAKVPGYSATPSRPSWWLSACRFSDGFQKSRPSAGQGVQSTAIITVSPVSKEPAPIDHLLPSCPLWAVLEHSYHAEPVLDGQATVHFNLKGSATGRAAGVFRLGHRLRARRRRPQFPAVTLDAYKATANVSAIAAIWRRRWSRPSVGWNA